MRDDVSEIYYDAARDDVEYVFGDWATAISPDGDVAFQKGAPRRRFDLVIDADGLHSGVRRLVFGNEARHTHLADAYISVLSVPKELACEREMRMHMGIGREAAVHGTRHLTDAIATTVRSRGDRAADRPAQAPSSTSAGRSDAGRRPVLAGSRAQPGRPQARCGLGCRDGHGLRRRALHGTRHGVRRAPPEGQPFEPTALACTGDGSSEAHHPRSVFPVELPNLGSVVRVVGIERVAVTAHDQVEMLTHHTFVPIPGDERNLFMVTCCSPNLALAESVCELFDAIASTFRFLP